MSSEEQKHALEIAISTTNIDANQSSSNAFDLNVFDSRYWEELPSFDELRSKKQQHHESTQNIQKTWRRKIDNIVDSIWFQTFMFLLVIFDFLLGFTIIIKNENMKSLSTAIIIAIYVIEILLRIYAYGVFKFFKSIFNIIDFIAVIASLILYIYSIYAVYALSLKILRWIRVSRATYKAIFEISRTKQIQKAIRYLQRSNLIGYKDDKYDLDIAYITDHILIMSRPSTKKLNQFQHDPLSEVKKFLDEKHKNQYQIYDLCVYDKKMNDSKPNLLLSASSSSTMPDLADRSSSKSVLSVFPIHIDISDGPNIQYTTFGVQHINNKYGFRENTVLSLDKIFEFAEEATKFADDDASNVVIIQSLSGLCRSMFMTACLLFYYFPTASIADILRFIQYERVSIKKTKTDQELFAKFLPSQLRYYRYFATLITHCYNLAEIDDDDKIEDRIQDELERNLTQHIEHIHYHHQQIEQIEIQHKSKWNFYHIPAMNMLNARIGIVIKQIGIYNYFEEIDPYIQWEADIFQWKQKDNDDILSCIQYDIHRYGVDRAPGKTSAFIQRFANSKPMVIEKDFGLRLYKSTKNKTKIVINDNNETNKNRKLCAQLILHSHFINLDNNNFIKFEKNQIDFVNKDIHNKHFPNNFHIVIKAKILRKKA